MKGQITQIGNGKDFLPEDRWRNLPSVMMEHRAPNTSDRYEQFSTAKVIDALIKENWHPVMVQEQRVNKAHFEDRFGFQKHLVRLRQPGLTLANVGDIAPEVILTNSHDATSAYSLIMGFFRLACLNGLMVSEGEFGSIKIRHMGYKESDVLEATERVMIGLPNIIEKVQHYRSIQLTSDDRIAFAAMALELKYPEEDAVEMELGDDNVYHIGKRAFNLENLVKPLRDSDDRSTVWSTFNVIQEKMTKGNRFEMDLEKDKAKKVRGITSINETVRINRGLWHLMDSMASLKAA